MDATAKAAIEFLMNMALVWLTDSRTTSEQKILTMIDKIKEAKNSDVFWQSIEAGLSGQGKGIQNIIGSGLASIGK